MATSASGRMIVYLVTGEYCFSENGEVGWQEGVFSSQESAARAAREAAADEESRRCLIDGEVYGSNWDCDCQGPEHESDCPADSSDWDISFEVHAMEVQD